MGTGVGLPEFELGRIIALVPETRASTFRLNTELRAHVDHLAKQLGKSRPEIVRLAIVHLAGTLRSGQPVFIDVPAPSPDEPKSHKRARRAA